MAEAIQGAVEDVMDQEIRYFAGLVYARCQHRLNSDSKETDIAALRTALRGVIADFRTSTDNRAAAIAATSAGSIDPTW